MENWKWNSKEGIDILGSGNMDVLTVMESMNGNEATRNLKENLSMGTSQEKVNMATSSFIKRSSGIYIWPQGRYEGELLNGIRHGKGSMEWSGRCRYEGDWKMGQRHGEGTLFSLIDRSEVIYRGEWKHNKKDGYGEYFYPSGNCYRGYWKSNQKEGPGQFILLKGKRREIYEGNWMEDRPEGHGRYQWLKKSQIGKSIEDMEYESINQYIGEFHKGARHGLGVFWYADESVYIGEWEDNQKHGQGLFIDFNGRFFRGVFTNDKMDQPLQDEELTQEPSCSLKRLIKQVDSKGQELIPSTEEETELFILLEKYSGRLRETYLQYSNLGRDHPSSSSQMYFLQFCHFLKDNQIVEAVGMTWGMEDVSLVLSSSGIL
jgi:hypothetical protein